MAEQEPEDKRLANIDPHLPASTPTPLAQHVRESYPYREFFTGAAPGVSSVLIGIYGTLNSLIGTISNPLMLYTSLGLIVIGVFLAVGVGSASASKARDDRRARQEDISFRNQESAKRDAEAEEHKQDRRHLLELQEKAIEVMTSTPAQTGEIDPKAQVEQSSDDTTETGTEKSKLAFHIGMPQFGSVNKINTMFVWVRVENGGDKVTLYDWHCKTTFEHAEEGFPPNGEGRAIAPGDGLIVFDHIVDRVSSKDFLKTKLDESNGIGPGEMKEGWMAFSGLAYPEVQIFGRVEIFCRDVFRGYVLTAFQRPMPKPVDHTPRMQNSIRNGRLTFANIGDGSLEVVAIVLNKHRIDYDHPMHLLSNLQSEYLSVTLSEIRATLGLDNDKPVPQLHVMLYVQDLIHQQYTLEWTLTIQVKEDQIVGSSGTSLPAQHGFIIP